MPIYAKSQPYRVYTFEEAWLLKGKIVKCDESGCDGKLCNSMHNKSHTYDELECLVETKEKMFNA
jgi:hypothetical protein